MQWKAAYAQHNQCKHMNLCKQEDIFNAGFPVIDVTVPGNFELDLMREGVIPDLYWSEDTYLAQTLENLHVWYFAEVEITDPNQYLLFGGIDTIADIYVNGKQICSTENMFVPCAVRADYIIGKNEVVVHIKPVAIAARDTVTPAFARTFDHAYGALSVRKAPHSYGWDIFPRILTTGLWKDVTVEQDKPNQINEVFLSVNRLDAEKNTAEIDMYVSADLAEDFARDYTVKAEGICKDHTFCAETTLWHNTFRYAFTVENPKLWWPKNAGEANVYDVTVSLYYKGELCDTVCTTMGIRTAELIVTDTTDDAGLGEFVFSVNGKRIFVMGTNHVPMDAFHGRDHLRRERVLELLDDSGCNMVRCWGGGVYESDEFFDFCDRAGIMVWQDFMMGCAVYPQDRAFCEKLENEAIYQIKRLRNHPSLVLWAGDNECDESWYYNNMEKPRQIADPNNNVLTRHVLRQAVLMHDGTRSYLASSPYMSPAFISGAGDMPERHMWGPRDYFKGDFYKNTFCHFASETGYHGFPSPKSLHKFLKNPQCMFVGDGITREYAAHAANPDATEKGLTSVYAFRIRLSYDQVETLFGTAREDLADYCKQSQISQAEAKKYFIEKFRIKKWKCTGIIWWNLIDGWPQISDAVVDYYFCKKLAYAYIKRSQNPVCFMFDEPKNDKLSLMGVNNYPYAVSGSYRVRDVFEPQNVLSGNFTLAADSAETVAVLPTNDTEQRFYLIEWEIDGKVYKNHFFTNLYHIDYDMYQKALQLAGFDTFEGFEE